MPSRNSTESSATTTRRGSSPTRMSARTIVPPPRASIISRRPSTEQSRSASPSQARALRRVRPAHAVVADLHHHVPVVAHALHCRAGGGRVLGHVRQRLRHHEVRRRLHRLGQPLAGRGLQLHRHRGAMRERLERGVEPAVAEHCRVDAARQLAQLLERRVELGRGRREQLLGLAGRSRQPGARHPQLQRHRHEPLLGSVVEVALEPAPLAECRVHPAPALVAQLLDLRPQLRVQALVLERQRGRGAHRRDQVALVVQGGVVHDCGHRGPVVLHHRGHPVLERGRAAPPADPRRSRSAHARQPVEEREAGVPESVGQGVAEPAAATVALGETRHQLAHRSGPRQPAAQKTAQEGERNQHEAHEARDVERRPPRRRPRLRGRPRA